MANYSYVVPSYFTPLTQEEILRPMVMYKEAYDQTEAKYEDLKSKSDKFKYLAETLPQDSKARQIYENYSQQLNAQVDDLLQNGLTMGNRAAITDLRGRYSGEIGMLDEAQQALKQEQALRREMSAKDSSMLYATDNLNIDDFLYNKTPNLYNISGNQIYSRGLQAGKSASSRIFNVGDAGSTLGGYYRDWVTKVGYSPESMAAFRQNASAIPELQMAADAYMKESGIDQNLTGINKERARESFINGIIDGAIYTENHNPVRDEGKMSASDAAQLQLAREKFEYEKEQDQIQNQLALIKAQSSGSKNAGGKVAASKDTLQISNGGKRYKYFTDKDDAPDLKNARKVYIRKENNGGYSAYIKTQQDNGQPIEVTIGSIDGAGNYTKVDSKKYKRELGNYFGSSWDTSYDDDNIKSLLQNTLETADREGEDSYLNYDYLYEDDNVSWSNDSGKVYKIPLNRLEPTVTPKGTDDSAGAGDTPI